MSIIIIDFDIKCVAYEKCMGRIESFEKNYSDHEGVYAEFKLNTASQDTGI